MSQILHSYLSGRSGRYHCGCSHIYNCHWLRRNTPPTSHTELQSSATHAAHRVHFGGSCPLGPYSSSVLRQLMCFLRLCLCALHTPSGSFSLIICWAQPRKWGRGENRAELRGWVTGCSLMWVVQFKLFFSTFRSGYSDTHLFKFCVQCCYRHCFWLLSSSADSAALEAGLDHPTC